MAQVPCHTALELSNAQQQTESKEDKDSTPELPVVKFSYANPHLEYAKMKRRNFYFADQMIEIKQSGDQNDIPTRVWDASIVLSHYLDRNRDSLNLKTANVLEIGAGLGLCRHDESNFI